MNVLIVEDVREEAEILKTIVSKVQGLEAFWCNRAEKALIKLEESSFDLFILDVQLPGRDGFSLAEQIRSKEGYQLTPILFVTGSDRSSLEAFKKYHCYDYIEKPYQQQELYEKLLKLKDGILLEKEKQSKSRSSNHEQELVCITSRTGDFYIKKSELLFVEIRRGIGIFYLTDKVMEKVGVNLNGILEDIKDEYILRCHKSFVLNLNNVQYLERVNYRQWVAFFAQKEQSVDISQKYYEDIKEAMQRLRSPCSDKEGGGSE